MALDWFDCKKHGDYVGNEGDECPVCKYQEMLRKASLFDQCEIDRDRYKGAMEDAFALLQDTLVLSIKKRWGL
jgi:hypothetical protein